MDKMLQRALDTLAPRGRTLHRLLGPEEFVDLATDEVGRALRYDRPLSVALLTVDELAEIKKKDGSPTAEELFKAATTEAIETLRRLDRVGRLGHGDLGILMPETRVNNAAAVMERLRRTVERKQVSTVSGARKITFSAGVAGISPRLRDPKAFLMRACFELRRSQASGRNTVCVAAPEKVKLTLPRSAQIH